MRTKKWILGLLFLILLTVGCKKNPCYHCYAYSGAFEAIKGSDTVSVGFILARNLFQDSVNHYISMGYRIDTFANAYFPAPSSGAVVCDTNSLYHGQPIPDSCSLII